VKTSPPTLILASGSPRRAQLLRQLNLTFTQFQADIDESPRAYESPIAYVQRMAQEKAEAVAARVSVEHNASIVLAADTCISADERILGKPAGIDQAMDYLSQLAGREHTVYSAVHVLWRNQSSGLVNCSKVRMKAMTQSEIQEYCQSGEPLDKAGAYAIQGLGAVFIQHIEGSYSGIMGLPLYETAQLLQQAGITIIRNAT